MGFELVRSVTLKVGAAINQYRFVEVSGANVVEANAATDHIVGVTLEARSATDITNGNVTIPVALPGCRVKVTAGAAVAQGAAVMTDATGRAITATATNRVQGIALTAAAAAGEQIDVLYVPTAGVA